MGTKAPLLPLVPNAKLDELTKENTISVLLQAMPNNNASSTYKVAVCILTGSKSVCVLIHWKNDVLKVLHGLNITTTSAMVTMTETMLCDTSLSLFQTNLVTLARPFYQVALDAATNDATHDVISNHGVLHNVAPEHIEAYLNAIIDRLVPKKALQCIKHYLH